MICSANPKSPVATSLLWYRTIIKPAAINIGNIDLIKLICLDARSCSILFCDSPSFSFGYFRLMADFGDFLSEMKVEIALMVYISSGIRRIVRSCGLDIIFPIGANIFFSLIPKMINQAMNVRIYANIGGDSMNFSQELYILSKRLEASLAVGNLDFLGLWEVFSLSRVGAMYPPVYGQGGGMGLLPVGIGISCLL